MLKLFLYRIEVDTKRELGYNHIYRTDGIYLMKVQWSSLMEKLLNGKTPCKMFYANGDKKARISLNKHDNNFMMYTYVVVQSNRLNAFVNM